MKEVLTYLGTILFTVLLLVKASAFHIYEHQDSADGQENHCEYCLLIIDSQQSDVLVANTYITENNFLLPVHQDKIISVDFQVYLSPAKTEQLPRPPPAVL